MTGFPTQWTHAGEVYTAPGGYTLTIVGSSVMLEHGDSLVDLTPEQAAELRRAAEGDDTAASVLDVLRDLHIDGVLEQVYGIGEHLDAPLEAAVQAWAEGHYPVPRKGPAGPVDDWRRPEETPTEDGLRAVLLVRVHFRLPESRRWSAKYQASNQGWLRSDGVFLSARSPLLLAWRPDTTSDPVWLTDMIPEVADA